ncbi:hypothetical protein RhiJN_27390 [Ceratobasidium sp. AG-Ba]|nr:hypothetical protein RhiJN_27390 [Ceratobasidium sp. AG-Ba]
MFGFVRLDVEITRARRHVFTAWRSDVAAYNNMWITSFMQPAALGVPTSDDQFKWSQDALKESRTFFAARDPDEHSDFLAWDHDSQPPHQSLETKEARGLPDDHIALSKDH